MFGPQPPGRLRQRVELAACLQEVAREIHPAEDAAQAVAHGVAGGDAAVDTGGIEANVPVRLTPAGQLLGPPHQLDRIVGLEAFLEIARAVIHRRPLAVIMLHRGDWHTNLLCAACTGVVE